MKMNIRKKCFYRDWSLKFISLLFPNFCICCNLEKKINKFSLCFNCMDNILFSFISERNDESLIFCFENSFAIEKLCNHLKNDKYPMMINVIASFIFLRWSYLGIKPPINKIIPMSFAGMEKERKKLLKNLCYIVNSFFKYISAKEGYTLFLIDCIDEKNLNIASEDKLIVLY